jgi:phage shock protein PspC (stress-responsive transcriptional regulator)
MIDPWTTSPPITTPTSSPPRRPPPPAHPRPTPPFPPPGRGRPPPLPRGRPIPPARPTRRGHPSPPVPPDRARGDGRPRRRRPSTAGRRSLEHRILGGVAAGVADYLDVDVVIIRIAFVALTVLGGSGVLLYAAGWLLIPADDSGRAVVQDLMERRPRRRSLVTIVLGTVIGIIALSNLFSSGPWWPHWDRGLGGFGFYFGLCALALAVALVVASGRRAGPPLRWFLATTFVAVLALTIVAVATVFSVEALSGVPLRGGVGDTQWRPTTAAQVAPRYRLAIGTMEVDLSHVTFGPGTTQVTASVGIGNLVVDLPRGTAVSVAAHSGLGDVQVFGQNEGGFSTSQTMQESATSVTTSATASTGTASTGTASPASASPGSGGSVQSANAPRIVLDAQTGVGHVQVIRVGP